MTSSAAVTDFFHYAAHRKWTFFLSSVTLVILFLYIFYGSFVYQIFLLTSTLYSILCLCLFLSNVVKKLLQDSPVDPDDKAVLVTGSASGFGYDLVKRLDSLGFTVFAGCRNTSDQRIKSLLESCSSRVLPVKLDVTSDDDVRSAYDFVVKHLKGKLLWSVVCNAGVYTHIPLDWGPEGTNQYDRIMKTNAFGVVRVVKTFLPLLKWTKGSRIVMTSSIAAVIPGPILAPYSMSKNALRAFGNSLRIEMRPFDVYVSQVQPVYYGTPLVEKSKISEQLEQSWIETPAVVQNSYSLSQKENLIAFALTMLDMSRDDPTEVVDVLTATVLTSREPDHFITVGGYVELLFMSMVHLFPSEMLDCGYFYPIGHLVTIVIIIGSRLFAKIDQIFKNIVKN